MNVQSLIESLAAQGVRLSALGTRVAYEAPAGVLTSEIKSTLREHKEELLALLETRAPQVVDALPGGIQKSQLSLKVDEVCAMSLEDFAIARLQVEVHSRVLDEVVIFASDNAVIDPGERRVIYRASELNELMTVSPSDLKTIHQAKRIFGGSIEPS